MFCYWSLSLNNVFATLLSWEFECWSFVRFIFGCLVISCGCHGFFWLVHCNIQGILALYYPLRSACMVFALRFELPNELDVVWLFFNFILVELREQVDCCLLDYHLSLFLHRNVSVQLWVLPVFWRKCEFWNVHCATGLDMAILYSICMWTATAII